MASKLSGKGDHAFDLEAEPEPLPLCGAGDPQSLGEEFGGGADDDYDDGGGSDHFDGGRDKNVKT